MKNLDRPAVRLVDETDERLAEVLPGSLAIELADVAAMCREGVTLNGVLGPRLPL